MDADEETPSERAERIAQRAAKMVYGKASSYAEMEAASAEFWRDVPQGEKLQATLELVVDSWYLAGNEGPPPGLDRTAYGVRKLID